jgi:HEAT repeat protein
MRGKWLVLAVPVLALCSAAWAEEPPKQPAGPKKEGEWVTYDEAGVKVLIRYLKEEKESIVLRVSLDTLSRLGTKAKPAVPAIVEMLKHPEWSIKLEAARTLIDIDAETKVAVQTLTDAFQAKDAKVRAHAAGMIGEIVNPPFEWPSCWGPGPRPRTPRPAIGKQAVLLLSEALQDDAEEVRCRAATSLGRIGADAKAAVPALLNALEDKSQEVRKSAAEALQRILVDAAAKAGVKEFQKAQGDYLFKWRPNQALQQTVAAFLVSGSS